METGIIKDLKSHNHVIINLEIRSECSKCSSNISCNRNVKCENLIEAICYDDVKIGDMVEVDISAKKRVVFAILIFLAPVLFLFLFYYISKIFFTKEIYSIIASVSGLSVYFILLFIVSKFAPEILKTKVIAKKINAESFEPEKS